tara:strand:- start:274 stop:627 length:354 start_codon:yes stop_codon:yes gene_type:complete
MEIPTTIDLYDGLTGSCKRDSHNAASPFVDSSKNYEGQCMMFPQVGTRFRCGRLDTNVVAKILQHTPEFIQFETLSGSFYTFTIGTMGVIKETIEISKFMHPDDIKAVHESVREYNK